MLEEKMQSPDIAVLYSMSRQIQELIQAADEAATLMLKHISNLTNGTRTSPNTLVREPFSNTVEAMSVM